MKVLFEEYGKIITSIICVSIFFFLFSHFMFANTKDLNGDGVNDSTILKSSFNTYTVDLKDFNSNDSVISDVLNSAITPHFKIANPNTNYKITANTFTRAESLNILKAYADDAETMDITQSVTVLVYKYNLVKTYVDSFGNALTNGTIVMEEIDATDKYGNIILDINGNPVKVSQPKYNIIFLGELTSSIDTSSDTEKYKFVYRVTTGTLKAEWSTFFIKEK